MEKSASKTSDPKTISLFQTNELFVHKILSRNSSVGSSSSRSYFGRVVGAVPFQWEARPGKPKLDAHKEEPQHFDDFAAEPPLIIGPPPGTHSRNMNISRHTNYSGPLTNSRSSSMWKKLKNNHLKVKKNKNTHKVYQCNNNVNVNGLEQFYHQADSCICDEEYMKFCSRGSSNSSSSSSTASASLSSSTFDALANFRPSKIQRLARGFIRWAF